MSSPFVKIVDDKLTIQTAVDIPDSESIRVVSILGKARMGKSTFLNAIVSKLGGVNKKPFATQDNDEHCTRGIDSYYCAEQKLLLLDCQGLALEDSSHDPALLLFAYLISDIIIFNERMMLQNEALKLMEPICAFMTYLSMDDVVKPRLYFRISDGDIVKDAGKNLEKVVFKRYNDQYQTIRDSITNLFHNVIGIVKTDSLDRAMKAKLADDDFLALFTDPALGFESSIDEILAALPTGRSAREWKQLVPKFIQNINNNEKITIDKLDVVGNAGKLEIREWLDELDTKMFTELPADGQQATYEAYIKPRQNDKKRILTEFTRKFKAVSETIKKAHYDKLATKLNEPIQKALDIMTEKAHSLVKKEWTLACSDKVISLNNNQRSFTSIELVAWDKMLPGHYELRTAYNTIYEPVKEIYQQWLDDCAEKLRLEVRVLMSKEAGEMKVLESFANNTLSSFIRNTLKLISALNNDKTFHALLVNPKAYVSHQIEEHITLSQPTFQALAAPRSLTLTIKDQKFHAKITEQVPAGSLFQSLLPLTHDMIASTYNEFVTNIRSDTIKAKLTTAVTERKCELLYGLSLTHNYTTRIPDVEFVYVHISGLSTMGKYMTKATFDTHFEPLVDQVLDQMEEEGYLLAGDRGELCRLSVSENNSNIVQRYSVGYHPEFALHHIFNELYYKTIAKERVKSKDSLYISPPMEVPA